MDALEEPDFPAWTPCARFDCGTPVRVWINDCKV